MKEYVKLAPDGPRELQGRFYRVRGWTNMNVERDGDYDLTLFAIVSDVYDGRVKLFAHDVIVYLTDDEAEQLEKTLSSRPDMRPRYM